MDKAKKNINMVHGTDSKIDKSLILNRIKSHYNFKSKADLARFLGIETNTLSNWYTRNILNYDLILTKCDELNPNWIINGLGNEYKTYINQKENSPSIIQEKEHSYGSTDQTKEEIDRLNNIINLQEKTIAAQTKTIAMMELLLVDKK